MPDSDGAAMATARATFERRLADAGSLDRQVERRDSAPIPGLREERRPDIAVLVYDLRASGVVLNAIRIAGAALDAGMKAELWVINDDGPMARDLPAGLQVRRIRQASSAARRTLGSVMSLPGLAAMLRARRPRVLFSAGNHVHAFAMLGHRLARVPDTRLVGRVSNALAATAPAKRKGRLGRALRAAAIRWERLQFGAMDRLIAVSGELGDDLAAYGNAAPRAVAVIPNGVDPARIAGKAAEPVDHPWFAPGQPPVVIAVGRMCRQKNFAQLVTAFAHLRRQTAARLVILGHGGESEREALLGLARDLGVADDLWLAGYQANPYAFMARARLFALTSRWEGGSNVLVEALACGLPVVATDCPAGVREVLSGQPAGRLVPLDDAAETARAMADLLARPHRPEDARTAIEDYRLSRCLTRYQSVLAAEVALAG